MMTKQQKYMLIFGILILVSFTLAIVITAQDENANIPEERPTLVPASELIPLEGPEEDYKEVVTLSLIVEAESPRQIKSVELEQGQITQSYAPNVFNLQGGPWEVEMLPENGEPIRFSVISPVVIEAEVEAAQEDENAEEIPPFEYVTDTEPIEWSLVLPLYRGESALKIQQITILFNEEEVFQTKMDYEEWRRQSGE